MAQMLPLQAPTLAHAALPAVSGPRAALLRNIALAVAGSLLLVLAAKIKVPFWPVPMTLQTLVVFGVGAAFGSRLGAATVALYIAYGLAGLPVFTNTPPVAAGPLYLVGPTGGFLVGFVAAAAIAGWAAVRGASLARLVGGLVVAEVVMMALGFGWLALGAQMAAGTTGIGFAKAFAFGVQPFILGDLLKLALVACLARAGWSVLQRRG
ncbi:MAG: biotin transporter BioY [Bosea sp. (in: a-proteobacteria)]|jgi:biotin transport system substrate-specific component|uniref:biotin transporter BioY n=1 Tax=Bosea sp. (in: a-proteobacteria) TaxID=1871050 RepID=UPI000A855B35|nr:biotin transporter BioY [Bosea sp. (in: a-proteobacteria)]MDP3600250.1 biotin transporter BioY [Bosea sp. (in: a-proteobacteria)]